MKKIILLLLVSALLCLVTSCKKRQDQLSDKTESMVVDQNISNQQITAFGEDALGYVWIGTARGLNRYNAHNYHQFFNTDDSTSLCDNMIQSIFRDSRKRLWISTTGGVCLFQDNECFRNVPIKGFSHNVTQILETGRGKILTNMVNQLCEYRPEKNEMTTVIQFGETFFPCTCYLDKSDKLWAVAPTGIRCYETSKYKLLTSIPTQNRTHYSYMMGNGDIWLASGNRLSIYSTSARKFISIPEAISNHPILSNAIVTRIYPYNEVSMLINTQKDGLFLYNSSTRKILHQSDGSFPFEVPDFDITTMYTDSHRNLWLGSFDQGYTVCYNYEKSFNNDKFLQKSTARKSVTSVTVDNDNNLWITTRRDGLKVYDLNKKQLKNIDLSVFFPEDKSYKDNAKSVFIDSDKKIWLITNGRLLKCSYEHGILKKEEVIQFTRELFGMTEDNLGTIWVSCFGNDIYARRKGEKDFKKIKLYSWGYNFSNCLLKLSTGEILLGSFNHNLHLINPDNWSIKEIEILSHIHHSPFVPSALYEDSEHHIWIGTIGNGLFIYTPETGKMKHLEGLACKNISSINEDVQGTIWISTLFGLYKYDKTNNHLTTYYINDGIGGNQFNERSSCRLPNHTLVFGGTHGLTLFNPIDVNFKRQVPIVFEDLKIQNKLVIPGKNNLLKKGLAYDPKIRLKHRQNNISISYAALDYGEFPRVRYFYKLEGFDKQWVDARNNQEAIYSNLPAGKYTFRVRISSNDKSVVEAENAIVIKVSRSPIFSIPAILLELLIILCIIRYISNLYARIRANKVQAMQAIREKEQEKKVNQMNMSFFSNVSHEFRTPLTMISGPVTELCNDESIQGENKQLLYIIQKSVSRMLRLVNQMLDFNKLENDALKLSVRQTDIIAELQKQVDLFRQSAREKGLTIKTQGLEDSFSILLDTDKLEKITANILYNAIKFTPAGGDISLRFDIINRTEAAKAFPLKGNDTDNNYVCISIADTGSGIPSDQLEAIFKRYYQVNNKSEGIYNWGTGIGLYYSRVLAEMHHGYLKAENGQNGGAVFTFILPVHESAYKEEEICKNVFKIESGSPIITEEKYTYTEKTENSEEPTILVVEDDTDVSHYLNHLLSPHYNVVRKYDADSAYKELEDISPDLILSDVLMPGTDGYQFCRMIKENISYCHIPVILLTAKVTVEDQVEGLNVGANAYMTKPFEPSYLLALIKSQLKNRDNARTLLAQVTKAGNIDEETLSTQDKAFMNSLYELMEKELSNPELNIGSMAEVLKISRTKLYYKVKGLTGENPNFFFRTYKLNRAAELLADGKYNVSEIADMTGFSTLSHFSSSFKKKFGTSPSEYRR